MGRARLLPIPALLPADEALAFLRATHRQVRAQRRVLDAERSLVRVTADAINQAEW